MDIEKEDVISLLITFCLLSVWYLTLMVFNYPLLSIGFLWIGMTVLSLVYFVVYRRKKRDMRIFKIRFIVSVIPIYSALLFYVYGLLSGHGASGAFRLLPIVIIGTMLFLNATVVYLYSRKP